MKRFISFLLMLVLVFSLTIPAFAADAQPRYKHIASFAADISYGNWGIATCSASVIIDQGYRVVLTLSLQKSSDDLTWEDVETWSAEGNMTASISEKRALYSNYSYRVLATARVYDQDGHLIESESLIDS